MYYMGDYYRGDYYRGDPFWGGLWSVIKGVGKVALGIGGRGTSAAATTSGGFSAAAIERYRQNIGGGTAAAGAALARLAPSAAAAYVGSALARPRMNLDNGNYDRGPIRRGIERILPGGRSGYECKPGMYAQRKNWEYTGKCLYRRMNPANPRALRRSLRRAAGFGKLAARARRDVRRAASAIGAMPRGRGPVARHHARIRAKA